jgi:DNA-binding FadR family transcriptional regulator
MTPIFEPVRKKRISELVAERIKETIFSGYLKIGDKLPSERDLALQMKVGRSVIRESLRIVESSGLIDTVPGVNGGIFVKELNNLVFVRSLSDLLRFGSASVENLTEARLLIEKDVVELVMKNNSKDDYQELDDLITLTSLKIDKNEKVRKENLAFHTLLADMCKNPIITTIESALMSIISVFVDTLDPPIEHSRRIFEAHKTILDEMKKGDMNGAKEKVDEHIFYFNEEFKNLALIKKIDFKEIF